jgi:hypothetical protein
MISFDRTDGVKQLFISRPQDGFFVPSAPQVIQQTQGNYLISHVFIFVLLKPGQSRLEDSVA